MEGQSIVIENKGGAAGAIGTDFAAKSPPDGYTIQLGTQSTNGSNKIFYPNLPYDPIKDFEPLTLLGTACMALVIPTSMPAEHAEGAGRVDQEAGWRRAYAAATGSSQHIAAELLVKRAGLKATLVPYRGSAAAQPDLMAGRVAFMFDNLPSALPQARAGKVKALAQTCATRSPSAPDLPTMVEAGFADFVVEGWYGMFAPARTPQADRRQAVGRHQQGAEGARVAREVEDAGLRSDRHRRRPSSPSARRTTSPTGSG